MKTTVAIVAVILSLPAPPPCRAIDFDLSTARFTIDELGYVARMAFADGRNWPATGRPAFWLETKAGRRLPQSVTGDAQHVRVVFVGGSTAEFAVACQPGFALFRLTELNTQEEVDRLNLFGLSAPPGATIEGTLNAAFAKGNAAAVMAAEPNVQAYSLAVRTLKQHGLRPAAFALLACPEADLLPTIERFEQAAGLPSPRPGGVWNKRSPWVKRSYFFLTQFGENQFDEALAIARRGGFDMILLGQESWCAATGHYEINRKHFPDGLEGLRHTIRRFKDAGFHVGLHFLGPSIYPPDAYLTPVPDPRLVRDVFSTLAADVDAKSPFLPVPSAPDAFPALDGGYEGPGSVLQIGDELIWYATRSSQPPGFAECRRGYLGTTARPHHQGDRVAHVLKSYGYFLFDMDTSLIDEAAANFARVANACDIDMVYFDGSERLQGDHWYYNARLHKTFYDKLDNKNMLLQASSFSHYSWHILARTASADGHGDLKGYLDERSPWFPSLARMGLPLDIGWYYGYDGNASLDMYEYILGATVGYDSSMSYQVSTQGAARHPFTGEILDLIARYEKLRLSGRVPAEMKARLRIDPALGGQKTEEERARLLDLRRDYRLLSESGRDAFQRVVYDPWHEVRAVDGRQNVWPVKIEPAAGRIGVQIHAPSGPRLAPGPAYDVADAVRLEDFADLAPYLRSPQGRTAVRTVNGGEGGAVLPGVKQWLEIRDDGSPTAKRYALYTAENSLASVGWSAIGRIFKPALDLSQHKAIGFWLRGDGHGGQFKLQFRDGKEAMDYYVSNNYEGWRYQQLVRPAKDAIDYRRVTSLTFYYNGLPGRTNVSCGVAGVRALRTADQQAIVDPYVELAGHRWTWKGALAEGQYLIFWPGEPVGRYGLPLSVAERLTAAENVVLAAGSYTAKFGCQGPQPMAIRTRITVQPEERYEIPAPRP